MKFFNAALVALLVAAVIGLCSPARSVNAAENKIPMDSYTITSQNGEVKLEKNGEHPQLLNVSWSLVDQYSYNNASQITLDFIGGEAKTLSYTASECDKGCVASNEVTVVGTIKTTVVPSLIWGNYNVYRAEYTLIFTPGAYRFR